jgi:hypothetical protein
VLAPSAWPEHRRRLDGNGAHGGGAEGLGHLTKRLPLCFDADAAGEDARCAGWIAAARGFDVRVVPLRASIRGRRRRFRRSDRPVSHTSSTEWRSRRRGTLSREAARGCAKVLTGRTAAARGCRSRCRRQPLSGYAAGLAPRAQRKTGAPSQSCARRRRPARKRLPAAVAADPQLVGFIWRPRTIATDDPLHQRLRAFPAETEADDGWARASSTRPPRPSTWTRTRRRSFLRLEGSSCAASWPPRGKTWPEPSSCRRS